MDIALRIARAFPAVIHVDVSPAVIDEAGGDHGIGCAADFSFVDIAVEEVPTIPAEGRGEADGGAADDLENGGVPAGGVGGGEGDAGLAGLGDGAGDVAGGGVEGEAIRQALGGDGDGALAGDGEMIEEWVAGALAVNAGAIDARGVGRGRGAYGGGVIGGGSGIDGGGWGRGLGECGRGEEEGGEEDEGGLHSMGWDGI